MFKYLLNILLIIFICSCNWFTTRDPEDPESGKSVFLPPDSKENVLTNFKNAIRDKNEENYVSCLADKANLYDFDFIYHPSAEARTLFPSVFNDWDKFSERLYFNSMLSGFIKTENPLLVLYSGSYIDETPDSVQYVADYYLYVNHNNESIPKKAGGTIRLTIRRSSNGLWSIYRWTDSKGPVNDSITDTWSILKARFL